MYNVSWIIGGTKSKIKLFLFVSLQVKRANIGGLSLLPVPHCSLGCGSHWTERLGAPREREVERESWAERRCNPDAEGNGTRRGCINQTVCWMSVDWSDFLTSACSYNWCYLCMEAILPPPPSLTWGPWGIGVQNWWKLSPLTYLIWHLSVMLGCLYLCVRAWMRVPFAVVMCRFIQLEGKRNVLATGWGLSVQLLHILLGGQWSSENQTNWIL